ncbi:RHS repeat-associated core domain-containing protein, partial [Geobacillus sp. 46C-IIa]
MSRQAYVFFLAILCTFCLQKTTGLYYLIARYYRPEQGVFLSLDPDPSDADDILTQNGYTYANNNPVMLVDPDGHWVWMAVGALIGGVSSYKSAKSRGLKGWK